MDRIGGGVPPGIPLLLRTAHVLCLPLVLALLADTSLAAPCQVRFDVGRLVGCQDVTTAEFAAVNPQERLLQARLEISALITQGDEENLLENFYQITSPRGSLQVVDYQPRTTAASDYAGNIGVEQRKESSRSLGLAASGGWDYFPNLSGSGELVHKDQSSIRYELVPPQELVAASGTMHRGGGVYFKLKRMRQALLEGSREFSVVFRAPRAWRADYLHVRCRSNGVQRSVVRQFDEEVVCGQADFLVALYLEGDETSRQVAGRFVAGADDLERTAARNRRAIHKQSYPTALHEFGALLGAVEPKISETWLSELLYLSQQSRVRQITGRLPDDVREAAHGYLAAREALHHLAATPATNR